jgi:RNA polymerase sigma-70 factor (ECF subfamily)
MITAEEVQYLQQQIARFDDQQAYRLLFKALYPYLYPFARALVKAKEPAEEVVSDVFIKVWEKRQDLGKIENLKVYLYVTTRHIAFNYLEKQRRNATNPLDQVQTSELISVYIDPEQLLITSDMMHLLRKAIDRLPTKCRLIFRLVKEDGLKYREVAEVLNISIKTVENQVAIALQKLGNAVNFDIKKTLPTSVRHSG